MDEIYAECHKTHSLLGGKTDGCQEYKAATYRHDDDCVICGCHRKFHRKLAVVYTTCQKAHDWKIPKSVDGCQEFQPISVREAKKCANCNCPRGFHKKEIVDANTKRLR